MTWIINNQVVLPHGGPQEVKRRVMRKQSADKLIQSFALPVDLGPDGLELQIKGLISPPSLAQRLWEIIERAEQSTITIQVVDDPQFETFVNNQLYAVNRADIGLSAPRFDAQTGDIVQEYDITFIQFPGPGVAQPIDTGELELDEPGVGLGSFQEFGKFILSQITSLFPNLFG